MDKIVKKAINNIIKFQITHTHTHTQRQEEIPEKGKNRR